LKKTGLIVIQIGGLYAFYKLGEWIQQSLHLPVPGSIIGMIILFLLLQWNMIKETWFLQGANWLLSYLSLLFVPSTVGIIQYLPYFRGKGLFSVVTVMVSTLLVLIIAGGLSQIFALRKENEVVKGIGQDEEMMM
jgi:holin-like protein